MILDNKKNKILFVVISIFVVCLILAIFIPFMFGKYYNNIFTITSNYTLHNNVINVDELDIKPGNEEVINIDLSCNIRGTYKVLLNFIETSDGTLKDYLVVTIKEGSNTILKEPLKDVLGRSDIYIKDNFCKGESINFVIIYTLPEDIGNEAQGISTTFDIEIIIKQE